VALCFAENESERFAIADMRLERVEDGGGDLWHGNENSSLLSGVSRSYPVFEKAVLGGMTGSITCTYTCVA